MGTDSDSDLETLAEAPEAGDVTVTRAPERAEMSLWEFVQHVRERDIERVDANGLRSNLKDI